MSGRHAPAMAAACLAVALLAAAPAGATPTWLSPVDVSTTGQDAIVPQVAMDAAGDAMAVWRRSNGANNIVQAAVRPAGGSFGAAIDVSATGQDADQPQV